MHEYITFGFAIVTAVNWQVVTVHSTDKQFTHARLKIIYKIIYYKQMNHYTVAMLLSRP